MKRIALVILVLLLPAFAQETPPPAAEDVAKAIDELRDGLITSFKKGDVDTLLTFLDPEIVVTWQNGEVVRGPDGVRGFYDRMMRGEEPVVREIQSEPKVLGRQVHGNVAVSWGNLHDRFILTDGSDLPFQSVFTANVAKRGDRWLVTAFHTSVNAFDNPVLGYAVKRTALWTGIITGVIGVLLGFIVSRLAGRRRATA
jgi:ketosteroid isomerase-like protein